MGKITKIILATSIIAIVIAYAVIGYSLNKSVDEKIARLEDLSINITKKKEYFIEQSLSLESAKKNLVTELALEKEKAKQKELVVQLNALNEEQKQKYLQQLEAQKLLDFENQQKIAAAKAAAAKASKTTTSSKQTTTTSPTASTPAAQAPKPPKVTRAS